MFIRLISDLHIDVNREKPFDLTGHSDVFTIIAGDTSGSPQATIKWINDNISKGIVVSGNHLVYNDSNLPIEDLRKELEASFPISNPISYLDTSLGNFRKEISDNVFILGSTLYTNCELGAYSDEALASTIYKNSFHMERGLNDFRFGRTNKDGEVRKLCANDYIDWFHQTIELFDSELTINESRVNPKDCIIVTHFCPSTKFIADRYRFSTLNAAYVSDLEWFIEKHPSIKLWVCGHVHSRIKDKIIRNDGSECLLISNPRGYCFYGESSNWTPDVFVDTDNWEITDGREN